MTEVSIYMRKPVKKGKIEGKMKKYRVSGEPDTPLYIVWKQTIYHYIVVQ